MKISLQRVSTKDLATLTERTLTVSTSGKYPVLTNHPLMNELTTHYADYSEVYTKKTFSGKGKDVAAADHDRDVAFSVIKLFSMGIDKSFRCRIIRMRKIYIRSLYILV